MTDQIETNGIVAGIESELFYLRNGAGDRITPGHVESRYVVIELVHGQTAKIPIPVEVWKGMDLNEWMTAEVDITVTLTRREEMHGS